MGLYWAGYIMKRLTLTRDLPSPTETQGILSFGDVSLNTIERPWIATDPGGKPNESCVPAGRYRLIQHVRPNGDDVVALVNHGLGVYRYREDRTNEVGRFLILIHKGNWSSDVVGCIAPGLTRQSSSRGPMVGSSKAAMKQIMDYLDGEDGELDIVGVSGYE